MKRTTRLICLQIAAAAAILSFGLQAHAESPREELTHAYFLVKTANGDYKGHRASALHAIEGAAHDLGMELKGGVSERERQWKSDEQIREANRLLRDLRDKAEERDRKHMADHLDNAIRDLDKALEVK